MNYCLKRVRLAIYLKFLENLVTTTNEEGNQGKQRGVWIEEKSKAEKIRNLSGTLTPASWLTIGRLYAIRQQKTSMNLLPEAS